MKKRVSQRLFWKKWPYKVILGKDSDRGHAYKHRFTKKDDDDTYAWKSQFMRWFKKHHPDSGLRNEVTISVFVKTKDEVDNIVDTWNSLILEVWAPENEQALALMENHVFDVIRNDPWYKKYPVRARILYTQDFKLHGLNAMRDAVDQMDAEAWYAGGQLKTLLSDKTAKQLYPVGQPFYLYLSDNEDAIMLKLQVGDWIDRFERQRKP
jgi:hypothetical protein